MFATCGCFHNLLVTNQRVKCRIMAENVLKRIEKPVYIITNETQTKSPKQAILFLISHMLFTLYK